MRFHLERCRCDVAAASPIAVVVEAKKNDIEGGLGQCIAQMVAADRFNQASGPSEISVFGCVTTGETWQFLRLTGKVALMERRRLYIDKVGLVLGAFQRIFDVLRRKGCSHGSRCYPNLGGPKLPNEQDRKTDFGEPCRSSC